MFPVGKVQASEYQPLYLGFQPLCLKEDFETVQSQHQFLTEIVDHSNYDQCQAPHGHEDSMFLFYWLSQLLDSVQN